MTGRVARSGYPPRVRSHAHYVWHRWRTFHRRPLFSSAQIIFYVRAAASRGRG
jgi:hypothetical protein